MAADVVGSLGGEGRCGTGRASSVSQHLHGSLYEIGVGDKKGDGGGRLRWAVSGNTLMGVINRGTAFVQVTHLSSVCIISEKKSSGGRGGLIKHV